jgi:hypothetical protein
MRSKSKWLWMGPLALLVSVMLLSIPVFAQDSSDDCSFLEVPRVSQTVNDEVRTPLEGGVHRLARAEFDVGRVDDNLSMEHIILMLRRSPEQELALITHIDEMHNPNSPRFHQWLSAEQFGACYGVADADAAAVSAWLESYGFRIDTVPAGKMSIIFSGTAGQVRDAFHTEIRRLNVNSQQHIANMTPPEVPAALAPVIAGIHSLHDFFPHPTVHGAGPIVRDAKTGRWQPAPGEASKNHPGSGGGSPLLTFSDNGTEFLAVGPQDFYTIYNETPLLNASKPINGAGQTLAVIEPTDINKADVTTFRSQFGLPAYPATPNSTQGGVNWIFGVSGYCSDPGFLGGDAQVEASLDAEWIGATAPAAIIDFTSCANTSTTSGVDLAGTYVVNSLAKSVSAISVSYGVCEAQLVTNTTGFQTNGYYKTLWQEAVAQGQTVVVSAGDTGDDTCDRGDESGIGQTGISVNGISSTPYNVSAGGTDFSDVYSNGGKIPTPYWNTNDTSPYKSALSYVPEMSWNNTCGSLVAAAFLEESAIEVCNISDIGVTLDGGGGGISTIYALPTWQSAYGVGLGTNFTSKSFRNLPDVSLFASDGLFWNHVLIFCDSFSGTSCDYAVGADAHALSAGGTSFVAPMLTGIIGLINQAHPSGSPAQPTRQGQANYTFYALATKEYGTPAAGNGSTTTPSVYTCESNPLAISTYSSIAPNCIFHEIYRTPAQGQSTCVGADNSNCVVGDNVQPCVSGTTACFTSSGDLIGLLSASRSTFESAFPQSAGYNAATGLGSVNIANLVNHWKTVTTPFASTTTLAASPTSISVVATTKLTATVTATGRGSLAPPLGTVAFYAGTACSGTPLGTSALVPGSGHATASLAGVTGNRLGGVGTKSAVACFSGDGANDAVSNGTTAVTVTKGTSITTLTSSKNPSTLGTAVTFTATIGPAGPPVPTGTVAFTSNGTTITGCSAVTVTASRTAACTTSILAKGTDTIKATYSGSTGYTGSSATLTQTVNADPSTTTLASSKNPSTLGTAVTFTATIGPAGPPVPTGTVAFTSNGTTITGCSGVTVTASRTAACTTSTLAKGTDTIKATYSGSTSYTGSSATLTQTVNADPSTTTLASSKNPSTVGQAVTLTATIGPAGPPVPTGTVAFTSNGTTITGCSAVTVTGSRTAACTTSSLAKGTDAIKATYSGNSTYAGSSGTVTQTVN